MAANPSVGVANPDLILEVQENSSESLNPEAANLLERIDKVLRRAFGGDDETSRTPFVASEEPVCFSSTNV